MCHTACCAGVKIALFGLFRERVLRQPRRIEATGDAQQDFRRHVPAVAAHSSSNENACSNGKAGVSSA
jgi:hypothetical protein